ncbi:hypothetical protein OC834_007776, partial [Tilletia horrida]
MTDKPAPPSRHLSYAFLKECYEAQLEAQLEAELDDVGSEEQSPSQEDEYDEASDEASEASTASDLQYDPPSAVWHLLKLPDNHEPGPFVHLVRKQAALSYIQAHTYYKDVLWNDASWKVGLSHRYSSFFTWAAKTLTYDRHQMRLPYWHYSCLVQHVLDVGRESVIIVHKRSMKYFGPEPNGVAPFSIPGPRPSGTEQTAPQPVGRVLPPIIRASAPSLFLGPAFKPARRSSPRPGAEAKNARFILDSVFTSGPSSSGPSTSGPSTSVASTSVASTSVASTSVASTSGPSTGDPSNTSVASRTSHHGTFPADGEDSSPPPDSPEPLPHNPNKRRGPSLVR